MVRQAAVNAQASYQQAVEMSGKLSAQLRGAEDRIRELEAKVRQHEDRADRAERWLHQVSVEIEQKFFGRDDESSLTATSSAGAFPQSAAVNPESKPFRQAADYASIIRRAAFTR